MKKVAILVCVLCVLTRPFCVALDVDQPIVRETITIRDAVLTGTTSWRWSGFFLMIDNMAASGSAHGEALLDPDAPVPFQMVDEEVILNLLTCLPCRQGVCGCKGINWGRITIGTEHDYLDISFQGYVHDLTFDLRDRTGSGKVTGVFRVIDGAGKFKGLKGFGWYTGQAARAFDLTLSGWFVRD